MVPVKPTRENVRSAVSLFDELFHDFRFDGDASRAHAFAAILTLTGRDLISGLVPMWVVTATAAGSGKGKLARCAVLIATGCEPPHMPEVGEEEEMRKRIASVLFSGAEFVLFDNYDRTLESSSLCNVLTAPVYSDRVLGFSELKTSDRRTFFMLTANNAKIRGDLRRRIFVTRIDPGCARPEQRTI